MTKRTRHTGPKITGTACFTSAEAALRAALSGDTEQFATELERAAHLTRRSGHKYLPNPAPKITVVVNCRPADLMGHNVFVSVTVATVSRFEAELAAMAEVRRQRLRHPVIVAVEYH